MPVTVGELSIVKLPIDRLLSWPRKLDRLSIELCMVLPRINTIDSFIFNSIAIIKIRYNIAHKALSILLIVPLDTWRYCR